MISFSFEDYRFNKRLKTEAEAIRRLIEAGLKAGERIPIRGAKPGGGSDQDAPSSTSKPTTGARKPAAPPRKAEPAAPISEEAQIRALREQSAR